MVDCIASHPYKGDEIKMIHKAIARSGRAMVLSLSPGPTAFGECAGGGEECASCGGISDDVWDRWDKADGKDWPQSVKGQFALIANWAKYARGGELAGCGYVADWATAACSGMGERKGLRGLSEEEQRTMITACGRWRGRLCLLGESDADGRCDEIAADGPGSD